MHKEGAQELYISTHHAAMQVPSAGFATLIVAVSSSKPSLIDMPSGLNARVHNKGPLHSRAGWWDDDRLVEGCLVNGLHKVDGAGAVAPGGATMQDSGERRGDEH